MRAIDIQNIIDNTDYWDEQVKSVECSYFSDEVLIAFDKVKLLFKKCYGVNFSHVSDYPKNIDVKDMLPPQLPYFLYHILSVDIFILLW